MGIQRRLGREIHRAADKATARLIRRGDRVVLWTPEELGFGNFLYLWLQAYLRQARGEDCLVLHRPPMDPWLALIPGARDRLTIDRTSVRLSDRRQFSWDYLYFDRGFTRDELHRFIAEYLVGSPLLAADVERSQADIVAVNIRRGDYYSIPSLRGKYGFDIRGYLEVALPKAVATGQRVDGIRVVSDGIEWCKLKLDDLLIRFAPQVEYFSASSPSEHFRAVATARTIVGTNSTFTYWAGFVSNVLYGEESHVVMPDFFNRLRENGRPFALDPSWDIVHEIPGGWDA